MDRKFCFKKKSLYGLPLLAVGLILLVASQGMAIETDLAGKPLSLKGYISQGVQLGVAGDHYDTKEWVQQALMQFLLEAKYRPSDNLTFFTSGNLNIDWAYPLFEHNSDWKDRRFDRSKGNLFVFHESETLLKEAHVTWSPGDFVFRLGKQIVAWGETDGVRLMDQINPQDNRRGISDVKFETTIIPIWLLKADYFPKMLRTSWLSDLGLEFVFNPNAQFIADKSFGPGNDTSGIWGLDITAPGVRIGTIDYSLERPRVWDPEGYEYGFRIKSIVSDALVTLNYFYGRENSPVTRNVAPFVQFDNPLVFDDQGRLLIHPIYQGFFPRMQFAGFTISRDIGWLRSTLLGGVAPLFRIEAQYWFDRTFVASGKNPLLEPFEKFDEIRYAVGIDWKIKIPFLNPAAGFAIYAQFIQEHINNYPGNYQLIAPGGIPVLKDNYTTTLTIQTTYFHQKLTPMVYWQRSYQGSVNGDVIIAKLTYKYSDKWSYALQGQTILSNGNTSGIVNGNETLKNKDNVVLTVTYSF